MTTIKKILVVEDSHMVTKVIRHVMAQEPSIDAHYAESFAEAKKIYAEIGDELFAALVDLNLPDAPDGEVVDYMLDMGVPTIVLTGSYDEERRGELLDKGIVDYVTKEGRYSYVYAVNMINRLRKNQDIKVLVVEDSLTSRNFICDLLRRHLFQVLDATDGIEAIKVLLKHPDIKLLITDYNMPNMDGFELVQALRGKYDKTDLIIIGLSAEGQGLLSAKFIKNGANDFLRKPFYQEEFYCRIMHNMESLELIEKIRDSVNRDQLTQAYNRRYFFEVGAQLYQQAQEKGTPLAAVVLDIDNFKQVNERYGNDVGDQALQQFAGSLSESLGRFLVARASGGEFFALLPGLTNERAVALIDKLREIIGADPVRVDDNVIPVSFSAGVSNLLQGSLAEQLQLADSYLKRAKNAGRNMVVGED